MGFVSVCVKEEGQGAERGRRQMGKGIALAKLTLPDADERIAN